jgi:glycosyltransferase involved in cell wall biosynthesis
MTGPVRLFLFSPILHSFLHQRPQKLAEQFVRRSIPVTFVEPSGFREYVAGRRPGLASLIGRSLKYHLRAGAMAASGARAARAGTLPEPTPHGLDIVSLPFVVPSVLADSEHLERLNARVLRAAIVEEILPRRASGERVIILAQTPFLGAVLRDGDADAVYYDCMDDIALFAGRASVDRFRSYERRLIAMSKAVFVTSLVLERELREGGVSLPVVRVPNGVDQSWFEKDRSVRGAHPVLPEVRSPIAGYVGSLREWFDEELVLAAARTMPAITFVLVGPVEDPRRLARLKTEPNVVFTGRIPFEEVPRYIDRFDVGLIPFHPGGTADRTNPVKLYEYFAFGKPVVTTPMTDLKEYEQQALVYAGEGKEGFVAALRAGLEDRSDTRRQARVNVAREHTWERAAALMLQTIDETLDA